MLWRFTILDRNDNETIIDEPTGWDANVSEIKRDLDWHGIVFTNQGDTFQFDGAAMQLLKKEYELYGADGNMTLIIEEDCGNGYEEFSRGKFMFKNYKFFCGDECYVKCPIETTTETKELRNRLKQKVNLDSTVAFDEATILPTYAALPLTMELPSKGIFLKDNAIAEKDISEEIMGGVQPPSPLNTVNLTYLQISFAMTEKAGEIGAFTVNTPVEVVEGSGNFSGHTSDTAWGNSGLSGLNAFDDNSGCIPGTGTPGTCDALPRPKLSPLATPPIVNFTQGTLNYGQISNPVQISFSLTGSIDVLNTVIGTTVFYLMRLPARPNKKTNGDDEQDYEVIYRNVIYSPSASTQPPYAGDYIPVPLISGYSPTYIHGVPPGNSIPFDVSFADSNFTLNNGDQLFMFMSIFERKDGNMIDAVLNDEAKAFRINLEAGAYFNLSNLSYVPPSKSKMYAINEAISRVAECITNGKLRAYSSYFGRTDSQPYSHAIDGCGGLEVITDGIRIRGQENRIPNKPSVFAVSLQDIFDGLNPIHNIGMGIEPDLLRPGYNRLRVERWSYFYSDEVVFSCDGVNELTMDSEPNEVFSSFKFGYNEWEAEQYTGLDEFLTKRSYRTTLSSVSNDYVQLSKFIASGYALEITRRIGDNNSKDWRYDKKTFIVCCKRDESGDMVVELGNVISPQNIIDPDTIYNYRISPLRNALRWVQRIFTTYKQINSGAKLIFTDGDANYFAAGEMDSESCKLEAGIITENETIDVNVFSDISDSIPFLQAERVNFKYPINSSDYKHLLANPYGLIAYSSGCEDGVGWIDKISYKPEEGVATFTLIPKK